MEPRPLSQPWLAHRGDRDGDVDQRPWSLNLEEAGLAPDAVEVVFRGADHGTEHQVEHDYERSLSIPDATRMQVILAYELRPSRFRSTESGATPRTRVQRHDQREVAEVDLAVAELFEGFQMWLRVRQHEEEDAGHADDAARAHLTPPGFPDFFTRPDAVAKDVPGPAGEAFRGSTSARTAAPPGPRRTCRSPSAHTRGAGGRTRGQRLPASMT